MPNERLSVDAMCTFNWSFEDDLSLWRSMGVHHAASLISKISDDPVGRMAQLREAGIQCSTLIVGGYNLADRETWEITRAMHHGAIDAVASIAGHSIYFTSGRTVSFDWRSDLELLAEAVEPTVAYGQAKGVAVALEPTQLASVSFVTNLADGMVVAERTGLRLVADFANIWTERDLAATLRRVMPHIALMQIDDVSIGTPLNPGSAGRVHIGQGDLPLKQFMEYALNAGYEGVFDLEVAPTDYTAVISPDQVRQGILAASALLDDMGV